MSNLTYRGPSHQPPPQQQSGGGMGGGSGGWATEIGSGPNPLHGTTRNPATSGYSGAAGGVVNRWLPDSPAISYPTTNQEARELYKSERSAAGLSWKRDVCTLVTRLVTGIDGGLLFVVSFLYMLGSESVMSNWFGNIHNIPPSARDICSALTQASGGLTFMCSCLLLAASPFVTARHAPWLALAHWISTLSISKNIFDSAPSELGVDRFIVAAAAALHLFPALSFSALTIANAITKEDPMMIAPWKSLQRGRSPANMVFLGLGCFYLLWSVSWMLFPTYTVQRSIYDRLSITPLKYAANNEFAVAGPFFFLGLLHIAFSGLASMTRELPLAAAFGHALNIGLDAVSWFSGGAMDSASFRPSILYGALFLHSLLALAHSVLAYSVQPHTGFVQMAQETANVLQQNIQQTMQSKEGIGEAIKQTLGVGGGAGVGGEPSIGEQMSSFFQKAKESLTPSDTTGAGYTTPTGSMTEKASQYAGQAKETGQSFAQQAKETGQSLAQQAKDTTQLYAEKAKEGAKSAMQPSATTGAPSTHKTYEEQLSTPAPSSITSVTKTPIATTKSAEKGTERGVLETKTTQHTAST